MGRLCDFCCEQRSIVYCRSDAACLCLSCDRTIHSANALSKRHSRTLICETCHGQPATIRCIDENISLCQDCNWSGHVGPGLAEHERRTIDCYSGCPSEVEFSRIWLFFKVDQSSWNREDGEKSASQCQLALNDSSVENDAGMDDILASDVEQLPKTGTKGCCCWLTGNTIHQAVSSSKIIHDTLYQDLSFENYDSLFDDAEQYFENSGINSLFEIGNLHGDECNFEHTQAATASSSRSETVCSKQVSADLMTSCKSDQNVCFPVPAQSTLSFSYSGLNGECENLDQPECITEEHLFVNPCTDYQLSSAIRDVAVLRYREKRKSRKFDKKIRYASRKVRADVRKRVKGRFVKAGEAYDYDPLGLIRGK
ncbi:Zinc finger protein CONSTANS-like [Castilleja foliolosa]|uniref:Zinc finger protein CONSTANS-like n=1 Tax=Castilleja foliolosa TaxID=1961234 RepID=A0ABD3DM06_9LAMI